MTDDFSEEVETVEKRETFLVRVRDRTRGRGALIVAVSATVAAFILLFVFAYLLITSDDEQEATPTPPVDLEVEIDGDTFEYVALSESGTVSITMETPIFISLGGQEFSVLPDVLPVQGAWEPEIRDETTASWIYGSVINYVFGLDDSRENEELLESLALNDEIMLTTRSGATTTFAVDSRQYRDSDDREIFAQRTPAITILLIPDDLDDQRLVLQGRYILSDKTQGVDTGAVVALGETAQLEELQITASTVSRLFDRPEIPAGFIFFLIDYQLLNVGPLPFDASRLTMTLIDDMGNTYALNASASQLGNYRPVSGPIQPGLATAGTAGFQLPVALTTGALRWQVRSDSGAEIQVNIPFGQGPEAEQMAAIQLQDAAITVDGTGLLLVGQITNLSEQQLVIETSDLALSSDGTVFLILSTNPAFPWIVGPGQVLQYAVTYQRPPGSSAEFTIASQSFQLTGLR